jgi:hypothetical protein
VSHATAEQQQVVHLDVSRMLQFLYATAPDVKLAGSCRILGGSLPPAKKQWLA